MLGDSSLWAILVHLWPMLIVNILVQWAPMLALIGVYVYTMRKYLGPRRNGMPDSDYLSALLQEQKRHNEALEKILARMEHQLPQ
jgi:hypothetical protein